MSDDHVIGFDSLEEADAYMAQAEAEANARLTPGQIALRDDVENTRYWAQALPDLDLVIYGIAQPNFIVARSADFDVVENRQRGYLTGAAYSLGATTGDYGDKHASEVVPISEDVFLMAQMLGWPGWSDLHEQDNAPLASALAIAERDSRA